MKKKRAKQKQKKLQYQEIWALVMEGVGLVTIQTQGLPVPYPAVALNERDAKLMADYARAVRKVKIDASDKPIYFVRFKVPEILEEL